MEADRVLIEGEIWFRSTRWDGWVNREDAPDAIYTDALVSALIQSEYAKRV